MKHPDWPQLTLAELLQDELPKLMPCPKPFNGYVEHPVRVSSTGLIHLERNRYSVPTQYAHRILSVRVYPTMINIVADGEKVAGVRRTRNRRHRERFIFPETVPMDFMTIRDQQFEAKGLLPSNPFLGALAYARERREGLEVYLNDPDVTIDTSHLERALRVIPMGRRNGMFCWTELGAKQVGMVQSLLVTCRLHDIDPYDYFIDVLQRVGQHPAHLAHQLTPRLWKEMFAANPLRSDLKF